jgi:signal transduction histidine kinase
MTTPDPAAPRPASAESRRPTVPPSAAAATLVGARVGEPSGRLGVELRVTGMVAALWGLWAAHAVAWASWAESSWRETVALPWAGLLVPQGLALLVVLGLAVHDLPHARWPRRDAAARAPRAWPWLAAGPAALAVAPVLAWRHRVHEPRPAEPPEVEAAFQRLVRAPQTLALRFAAWATVAAVVDAVVLGTHAGWPKPMVIALATLWIGMVGPMAAVVHGLGRAMLRPEVLAAPRPHAAITGRPADLRGPFVLTATATCVGTIAAPLAAGYLWLALEGAGQVSPALVRLLVTAGAAALVACVVALVLVAMDLRRDVVRAAAQVAAVIEERPPEALSPGSLSTVEVQRLMEAVDRLIERIGQATVAKYVAIERAKEGDRLKSQFLANMSHDLRSPLNSILGFSELLLRGIDGELTAEQRAMVQTIHDNGRELLQQIDDILDTAKLDAHRLELHPEPTPPANLISRAIKAARERQRGTLEYQTEVAPGLRPAFVDPFRAVQALTNVLLFAGERMTQGTLHITLREGWVAEGPRIYVQVHTPVRPASTDHLARARRGFYRIPGHRGLGLGLPLAGAILELSGGSLSIEDEGEGMVLTAMMPAPQSKQTYLRMRALEGGERA